MEVILEDERLLIREKRENQEEFEMRCILRSLQYLPNYTYQEPPEIPEDLIDIPKKERMYELKGIQKRAYEEWLNKKSAWRGKTISNYKWLLKVREILSDNHGVKLALEKFEKNRAEFS